MSIHNLVEKIKSFEEKQEIVTMLIVILVGVGSFGLGRLSADEYSSPSLEISGAGANVISATQPTDSVMTKNATEPISPGQGGYVGSKNSNKYHLPWCSGAQNISETNKVWFATKEDAEKAGYVPAGNCKGI